MSYDKVFQAKVWPIIISELALHVAPVFSGRLSKNIPTSLTQFPVGVYQSQDGGGSNDDHIGNNGWLGQITFRSIDTTISGAWNKALDVANALLLIDNSEYDISVDISRPIEFPVEKLTQGSVYTAGLIVTMGIYPKTDI
jgi:hypothetical protein